MKANELMIGDWVYNAHHKKCIMITAYDFFTHHHNNDGTQSFLGIIEPMPTRCFDLAGIPLTEEILKANGYRLVKDQESNYCGGIIKNDELTIWVHLGDKYNYHTRIVNHKLLVTEEVRIDLAIRYVHELQHALRLCGLNELADNFKIE